MSRSRSAVAIALLCAALAAAGCGLGAGDEVGEVTLTVTRDYGAEPVAGPVLEAVAESDTAMRVLDRRVEVETRYGGGFVRSIDRVAEATRDGRRLDWFFYVNGVESPVGAAAFELHGGEAIWWDYREWAAAPRVPAVVGSFPGPLVGGYDGRRRPVALDCRGGGGACAIARTRLRQAGVALAAAGDGAIRVLVGTWARLRDDPAAAQIEAGPRESGVFARFVRRDGAFLLQGLSAEGDPARELGPGAGLVAATRRGDAPPVWVVTAATRPGLRPAAELLHRDSLRDRYAVAVEAGEEAALPLR